MQQNVPPGYEERSSSVSGFWTEETPIHFRAEEVHLFDSALNPTRASALIIGRLKADCPLVSSEKTPVQGRTGELVGVWYRPGLSALPNIGQADVYVVPNGTKDVGKPSPMKVYRVYSSAPTGLRLLGRDYRSKSKSDTALDAFLVSSATERAPVADDIPDF